MGYDKQKIINIALAEVGYIEKASASQLDSKTANTGSANFTKYARDLDAISFYNGRKQGMAWCDVFVDWCFVQAYGKSAALAITFQPKNAKNNCGAGCKYSMQYYQQKGQLYSIPQPGDQIFFRGSDGTPSHTGLVYKVSGSTVYTIEGNTSSTSGVVANGGAVCKKSYPLTSSRIAGYGRPAYGAQESSQEGGIAPESSSSEAMDKYTTYTVKKGDTLSKIAKALLGKSSRYPEIAKLNNLSNPNKISIGQVLKIPNA